MTNGMAVVVGSKRNVCRSLIKKLFIVLSFCMEPAAGNAPA